VSFLSFVIVASAAVDGCCCVFVTLATTIEPRCHHRRSLRSRPRPPSLNVLSQFIEFAQVIRGLVVCCFAKAGRLLTHRAAEASVLNRSFDKLLIFSFWLTNPREARIGSVVGDPFASPKRERAVPVRLKRFSALALLIARLPSAHDPGICSNVCSRFFISLAGASLVDLYRYRNSPG